MLLNKDEEQGGGTMGSESSSGNERNKGRIALITAIIGLIAASIPLISKFGDSDPERRDQEKLLSSVPDEIRPSCSADTTDYFRTASAAIECEANDLDILRVALFKDTLSLNAFYAKARRGRKIDSGTGTTCAEGTAEESWGFDGSPVAQGRYFCYVDNEHAWIEWTQTKLRIYAYAVRGDDDLAALYKWWHNFNFKNEG
jgi:hypothetical protein